MTSSRKPLSVNTILGLAGQGAFDRGEAYFREGRVASFSLSGNLISALVEGQSTYRVHLRHTVKQFEGSCECPASDGFDFCKHCVAVALYYLDKLEKGEKLKSSAGRELLATYLAELDKDTLVEHLIEHIENNQILLQNWMLRAEAAAEKLDAKSLKKHLTRAIPYNRHLYRYQQVRDYFSKLELVLDSIGEHAENISAHDIIKLVEYAMTRITRALQTVDDSGGFRFHSLERLGEMHRLALGRCDWSDEEIAKHLMRIYFGESADLYPPIPQYYSEAVDEKVLEHFYDLLHQRWKMLPALEPDHSDSANKKFLFLDIARPLLQRARKTGNRKAEIQYLEKGATSVHDMLELSELHLKEKNSDAAWEWLRKAKELADQSHFGALQNNIAGHEVQLLLAEGNTDQALARRWVSFKQHPSLSRYRELTTLARQIGDDRDWHGKSVALLTDRLEKNPEDPCAEALAGIFLDADEAAGALGIAERYALSLETQTKIVMHNLSRTDRSLKLAGEVVRLHVSKGNNDHYLEAVTLLKAIYDTVSPSERPAVIRVVKEAADEFRAKRNFRKWLREEFDIAES